ncbi:hypothetical protein PENSPDRAFT_232101 [Peniophora sp. CONT]|nr:hypothetical protein PENSPDRAFT_232101 [Peniophora sp. CONT]
MCERDSSTLTTSARSRSDTVYNNEYSDEFGLGTCMVVRVHQCFRCGTCYLFVFTLSQVVLIVLYLSARWLASRSIDRRFTRKRSSSSPHRFHGSITFFDREHCRRSRSLLADDGLLAVEERRDVRHQCAGT